jgi:quercetin dioxygenase-like cupin family protein
MSTISPTTYFSAIDGVFVKQMHFEQVGSTMYGHKHTHNHLTLLAHGKLKVTVNGEVTEFTAPHLIFIHKDNEHELVALEENTVAYCVHAIRDKDTGDIIEDVIVPLGVKYEEVLQRPIRRLDEDASGN